MYTYIPASKVTWGFSRLRKYIKKSYLTDPFPLLEMLVLNSFEICIPGIYTDIVFHYFAIRSKEDEIMKFMFSSLLSPSLKTQSFHSVWLRPFLMYGIIKNKFHTTRSMLCMSSLTAVNKYFLNKYKIWYNIWNMKRKCKANFTTKKKKIKIQYCLSLPM